MADVILQFSLSLYILEVTGSASLFATVMAVAGLNPVAIVPKIILSPFARIFYGLFTMIEILIGCGLLFFIAVLLELGVSIQRVKLASSATVKEVIQTDLRRELKTVLFVKNRSLLSLMWSLQLLTLLCLLPIAQLLYDMLLEQFADNSRMIMLISGVDLVEVGARQTFIQLYQSESESSERTKRVGFND